ncbi:MAG: NAD(P)H-dependent glycerol-3-phosphate dehydrogenase [Thermomicrobiales bacterium]
MGVSTVNGDPVSVAVVGSGAWGTTLALLVDRAGGRARLWVRDPAEAEAVGRTREHRRRLPGHHLPASVTVSADIGQCLDGAGIVIVVVPSQTVRETVRRMAPRVGDATLVSATKGFEEGSLLTMTGVFASEMGQRIRERTCALSGPNLAGEIAAGKPAATVVAGPAAPADRVRAALASERFRPYTSGDVTGVEIAAALKNVYAIGAGIGDGLAFGDSAKAAFMSRAIVEMGRLGVAMGADPLTFAGLAGIGDLIATCQSPLSRNNQFGRRIAAGEPVEDALAGSASVVEGVFATRAGRELAGREGVDMPILEEMARVLFEGRSPADAIAGLLGREPRSESEPRRH